MLAATLRQYGPADVLRIESREMPTPGPKEIRVEVHASTVTTADWRLRAAAFPNGLALVGRLFSGVFRPRHEIPGVDLAGVVIEVGHEVTRFRPGDRVFGFAGHGAHAEHIVLAEDAALAVIPEGVSFAQAATLPFGAVTAHVFLKTHGKVQPGERVLVNGASGGVGYFAVQIAKALGAEVTAVASAPHLDFLKSLGADHVIDYRSQDVVGSGQAWDVIFDAVGTLSFKGSLPILAPKGRFLALNGGPREMRQSIFPARGGKRLIFTVAMATPENLAEMARMVADGTLTPIIEQRYPLERIVEAHNAVETRHRAGTIVLDIARDRTLWVAA